MKKKSFSSTCNTKYLPLMIYRCSIWRSRSFCIAAYSDQYFKFDNFKQNYIYIVYILGNFLCALEKYVVNKLVWKDNEHSWTCQNEHSQLMVNRQWCNNVHSRDDKTSTREGCKNDHSRDSRGVKYRTRKLSKRAAALFVRGPFVPTPYSTPQI